MSFTCLHENGRIGGRGDGHGMALVFSCGAFAPVGGAFNFHGASGYLACRPLGGRLVDLLAREGPR